jgi:hypothetical protein
MGKLFKPILKAGTIIAGIAVNVIPGLGQIASTAILGTTIGTLASVAGLATGLGVVGSLLEGNKPDLAQTAQDLTTGLTISAEAKEIFAFGETFYAMQGVYVEQFGSEDQSVLYIAHHASHRVESIDEYYHNDTLVTETNGDGTGDFGDGALFIRENLGTSVQPPLNFPETSWDGAFLGCAHSGWQFTPSQENPDILTSQIRAWGKAARVYDPRRDSTVGGAGNHRTDTQVNWQYDDAGTPLGSNLALVVLRIILGEFQGNGEFQNGTLRWGIGEDPANINMADFIIAANIADELTNGKRRYHISGVLDMSGNPYDKIRTIMAHCGGWCGRGLDGRWTIRIPVDDLSVPDWIITASDLRGVPDIKYGDYDKVFNQIIGRCAPKDALGKLAPWPVVADPALQAEAGATLQTAIDYPFYTDQERAQYAARQYLRRSNYNRVFECPVSWAYYGMERFDTVRLDLPEYGYAGEVMRCDVFAKTPAAYPSLALVEENASIYDETQAVSPNRSIGQVLGFDPSTQVAVNGLALNAVTVAGDEGQKQNAIEVSWTLPSSRVKATEIRYRRVVDTEYQHGPTLARGGTLTILPGFPPRTQIRVETRHISSFEVPGPWSSQVITTGDVLLRPLSAGPENFAPGAIGGQGNLRFTTDAALSGAIPFGEFRHLDGNTYTIATDLRVTLPAGADGVYYIMFSAQNVQDETPSGRFQALGARGDHQNFILFREVGDTIQAVDQEGGTLDFTVLATDAAVFGLHVSGGEIVETHSFMALLGNDGEDGVLAYVAALSNEAHTVATAADGSGGDYTDAGGTFRVFAGTTDVTDSATLSIESKTPSLALTLDTSGANKGNYDVTDLGDDQGFAVLRAVYNGVTIDQKYTIAKSRAGANGSGANAELVSLNSTATAFTFDGTGSPQPSSQSIDFTATSQNLSTSVVWSVTGGVSLTGTGNARTLDIADFGALQSVSVTVTAGSLSDTITVVRLQDGAQGDKGDQGDQGDKGDKGDDGAGLLELFDDAFDAYADQAAVLEAYHSRSGNGEISVVTNTGPEAFGGKSIQIGNASGNDQRWLVSKKLIPFDPNQLYMVEAIVERVSGSGSVFIGIEGLAADGVTRVDTNGNNTLFSQHYFGASGATPALGEVVTYRGFFRGVAASGNGGHHPNDANPGTVHESSHYVSAMMGINYNAVSGETRVHRLRVVPFDRARGTEFPPNPKAADGFYRTDLKRAFLFDGANWIAELGKYAQKDIQDGIWLENGAFEDLDPDGKPIGWDINSVLGDDPTAAEFAVIEADSESTRGGNVLKIRKSSVFYPAFNGTNIISPKGVIQPGINLLFEYRYKSLDGNFAPGFSLKVYSADDTLLTTLAGHYGTNIVDPSDGWVVGRSIQVIEESYVVASTTYYPSRIDVEIFATGDSTPGTHAHGAIDFITINPVQSGPASFSTKFDAAAARDQEYLDSDLVALNDTGLYIVDKDGSDTAAEGDRVLALDDGSNTRLVQRSVHVLEAVSIANMRTFKKKHLIDGILCIVHGSGIWKWNSAATGSDNATRQASDEGGFGRWGLVV